MIDILNDFRRKLDEAMLKCMHKRVAIYGYDSYTGRFLKWYAKYYHGIEVDFLISEDMSTGRGYELEIFRPSVLDFGYRDIKDAIIWMAQPMTSELSAYMEKRGYYKGDSTSRLIDFYDIIYGSDLYSAIENNSDIYQKRKTGKRDIQFLEWLEWKYGCNFIQPIAKEHFQDVDKHGSRYSCSTQKEIFPILDRCHIHPSNDDGIFDFGCGKGGAMISFLDYGFKNVGGVEYEKGTFEVAKNNFSLLNIDNVELVCGDAREITETLDKYNYFYFFFPFDREIFEVVINNIKASYLRKPRKMHIIYYTAMEYDFIESTGIFRLVNQFTVDSRQRVVGIFDSYEE